MTRQPLKTDDLDFDLPKELIATRPVEPRDSSRLLVVQRSDPDRIEHRVFSDLPELLAPNDLLVFNESRVVPARLIGVNPDTGGKFEGLFLNQHGSAPESVSGRNTLTWIVMLKAKRTKPGKRYQLIDGGHRRSSVVLELVERYPADGPGAWVVLVTDDEGASISETSTVLDRVGHTPLPPYIVSQRKARAQDPGDAYDRSHYQTVYANEDEPGSVAAPTAGLHFTKSVFDRLAKRDIATSEVVLHVGAGTFKPVETDTLDEHPMHAERCSMGKAESYFSGETRRRTFAVGSTSARTLESFAGISESGDKLPESYSTRILISPGYRWRWVDGMITNFHLPRSTLLAMVASMLEVPSEVDGVERIQEIYSIAIARKYRFFSYGDAMLILP